MDGAVLTLPITAQGKIQPLIASPARRLQLPVATPGQACVLTRAGGAQSQAQTGATVEAGLAAILHPASQRFGVQEAGVAQAEVQRGGDRFAQGATLIEEGLAGRPAQAPGSVQAAGAVQRGLLEEAAAVPVVVAVAPPPFGAQIKPQAVAGSGQGVSEDKARTVVLQAPQGLVL
jgi:hypothetical protein